MDISNYKRTAYWLQACGKTPCEKNLAVQIGCHLEEFCEFLATLSTGETLHDQALAACREALEQMATKAKRREIHIGIPESRREDALDALCDAEVTGNGVAYLAGFDKPGADRAVLASNDAKLVGGKPVLLEGGKIGKPADWRAPDLRPFV
jgi:predicted HAD superfamily Cof-like phosphohydrolase